MHCELSDSFAKVLHFVHFRFQNTSVRRAQPIAAAAAQFSGRSISWLEIHDQTATSYCLEQFFQSESDCMTRQAAPARRRPRTGP